MDASVAEPATTMADQATEVVVTMLAGFDAAPTEVQFEVPQFCERLTPMLVPSSAESLQERVVHRIEEMLAADEWSASDEACERHARLYRVAIALRSIKSITEPLEEALRNDAARIPTEGWTLEVLRRARQLGAEAPNAARQAIVDQLPASDWEATDQAAAAARARAELIVALGDEAEAWPLSAVDARAAFETQGNRDARAALIAWLAAGPSSKTVRTSLLSNGLRHDELVDAIAAWAKQQPRAVRTEIAMALISCKVRRHRSLEAVTTGGIDERKLVNHADKRMRPMRRVEDRRTVAETLSGHTFRDQDARAQMVRLIAFLLKPSEPKANMEIVNKLLSTLGQKPLVDPDPLSTAIRRAQKRWKLKLTENQGAQLVALGVRVEKGWFGERIGKRVWKRLPKP
jgi:hypothetical protein